MRQPIKQFRVIDAFFILLVALLTFAFYKVLSPFLIDLFLAMILVNLLYPVYRLFTRKLRPGLSSILTVLIFLFAVLALVVFFGIVFGTEAVGRIRSVQEVWPDWKQEILSWDIDAFIEQIPFADQLPFQDGTFDMAATLDKLFSKASELAFDVISKSFTGIATLLVHFIFMLFIMFFLFFDGPVLLEKVRALIPLDREHTEALITEITTMTRATIISTLLIGLLEGTFGGIIFIIFKIPSPALWAVVIAILSMIPAIGSNLIIIPVGIIRILTGQYVSGIIIVALGITGIAISQNIIKPKLLGGRSGLHPLIVLLATLGGIAWLGLVGFIIGPMIASMFIVVWHQFAEQFKTTAGP